MRSFEMTGSAMLVSGTLPPSSMTTAASPSIWPLSAARAMARNQVASEVCGSRVGVSALAGFGLRGDFNGCLLNGAKADDASGDVLGLVLKRDELLLDGLVIEG